MKAKVNGIEIEGTPQEIAEYVRLITVDKPKVTGDYVCKPYWMYQPWVVSESNVFDRREFEELRKVT